MNYQDYLQGEHWQLLKRKFWTSKLSKNCKFCKRSGKLELHHKYGYGKLGEEKLLHLVPLCRACHQAVHYLPDGTKIPNVYDNLFRRYKSLLTRKGNEKRKPYNFIIKL